MKYTENGFGKFGGGSELGGFLKIIPKEARKLCKVSVSKLILSSRSRSPRFGVGRRGSPRFVPISPFSSDLFRFALRVFGNAPICSDLLRFLPICSDLFSEQIRETPFCRPLLQIPDRGASDFSYPCCQRGSQQGGGNHGRGHVSSRPSLAQTSGVPSPPELLQTDFCS